MSLSDHGAIAWKTKCWKLGFGKNGETEWKGEEIGKAREGEREEKCKRARFSLLSIILFLFRALLLVFLVAHSCTRFPCYLGMEI